uniref:RING finger protein 17 isoform X3 n=1 Tax=Monopterus albus TaxID=43700 RepID=UPI0009B4E189|nr:RING finger protein 17 isoform X3 [Monopterus albus]
MMDRDNYPNAAICKFCGEVFSLPEEETEGNPPRVLLCGHIYCTSCLESIEHEGVIKCPECEVESTLPEGGVCGLQQDSRIIGLIYTVKMNKMKSVRSDRPKNSRRNKFSFSTDDNTNTEDIQQPANIENEVAEVLVRAAENLAQLEHIRETLKTGLAEQVKRDTARLDMEIKQVTDAAVHIIQEWRDVQLSQLTKLEAHFFTTQEEVRHVQERITALETAMQMAREVRHVPLLEQYCTLNKVLETLQAPVDDQSFDMKCITVDSGVSCVLQSESLTQGLALSLKMEVSDTKHLPESPPKGLQSENSTIRSQQQHAEDSNSIPPSGNQLCIPEKQGPESAVANGSLLQGPHPHPGPCHSPGLDDPDIIIEEFIEEEQEHVAPPTGPELADDKWRLCKRRKNRYIGNKRIVTFWVMVSHIVNPSNFYIHYMSEKKERECLSKILNYLCSKDDNYFTSQDTVKTGSMIFVKSKERHWFRAVVVEIVSNGCVEVDKACPVIHLARVRVFCSDYGLTQSITIQSEKGTTESVLKTVNEHLRKFDFEAEEKLRHFAPQAIKCSLKGLVPYDLTKGWSKEAQVEFSRVVGSEVIEMRTLGQDGDSLLVDLRKVTCQSSDVPLSIREFLVFIEVARFYSPLTLDRKPLQYYPPVYPKINTPLCAAVSHINTPADFYIDLVDNMESFLLSSKLQACYSLTSVIGDDDLNIYCPVIGQACVARYDDGLWQRAQVLGHPGDRKVEVLYVDLGSKEILPVSDLRKIKDEFFALPSKAIPCCLSGVIPLDGQTWSDACMNRFISLARQNVVTVKATGRVPKTERLPVALFCSSLDGTVSSIAELLVSEGLACFKEGCKPEHAHPLGFEPAIWDPPLTLSSEPELVDIQPDLWLPSQLKDLKVRVSHVNSPSSFYVQLTQYDSQLKRMCELVKECALKEPKDVVWKADMYCAAHINGVWERGQISSDVTSSSIVEVKRCDYGNTVNVHVSNLRPLLSSLMGSLALECTLTDISPTGGKSTWTATACDLFSYYLTGASAVMTVKEVTDQRPLPVTLFCSNKKGQFLSIADFLLSEGLALRERKARDAAIHKPKETDVQPPVSETQMDGSSEKKIKTNHPVPSLIPFPSLTSTFATPKPAPCSILSAEKVATQLYHPPELPCLGHIRINVSAIGEDGLIYVRTQNAVSQLEQLRVRIQQNLKTLPRPKPYTWKSVLGCAVIGPDMLWYRGQVLEVLGGHVKVQYVDYGLVENIPVVHVYPRLLCDDIPQLCMPCQLHSINPVGGKWQPDAVVFLREMLLDRCVDMQVTELPSNRRGPLTVELFLDGMSVSRILCHHRHATMDRTFSTLKENPVIPSPPLLDVWDIDTEGLKDTAEPILGPFVSTNLPQGRVEFPVRVKHLLTPNELFLWSLEETADVKVNGETLAEALARINANIHSLPKLTNFPPGCPCLAEYSDGTYYRAKLIKITSVEPVRILVQHVDFGSDDTLPPSKLRQIPAELMQFPTKALKVRVAGFKAPSDQRDEDVLPYSPAWSLNAVIDMIDLLHGNITASVVAREPELTVQLYNEDGELVHLPLVHRGLAELE